MNSLGITRLELLSKDNYDTWALQMKAILIKNGLWKYVDGTLNIPECKGATSPERIKEREIWVENDEKAKADIILSIAPSELKQIKHCETANEIWLKLKQIYQSQGPVRKATLMEMLTTRKMSEGEDVHEHIRKFFDVVDKLEDMDVEINKDLLSIMLLNSLPSSYDNFRCAIKARDDLPNPETLRIKILEENSYRNGASSERVPGAFVTIHKKPTFSNSKPQCKKGNNNTSNRFIKCYRCHKFGHKSSECTEQVRKTANRGRTKFESNKNFSMFTDTEDNAQLTETNIKSKFWCLDSGCTAHLCNDQSKFNKMSESDCKILRLANGDLVDVSGKGTVQIKIPSGDYSANANLNEVLFVPNLKNNLLSIAKITDKNFEVLFKKDCALILDNKGEIVFQAKRLGDLYFVCDDTEEANAVTNEKNIELENLKLWHRRLGHLNIKDVYNLSHQNKSIGLNLSKIPLNFECEVCIRGKMTSLPYPKFSKRQTGVLEIIHSDVCGPMRLESLGKSRYFVTFIDDSTKWCEVYFINKKSDVLNKFKEFVSMIENLTGRRIKYLQSDNGTEYVNSEFDKFLKEKGIRRRLSAPYSPEQNGTAERKNRTLVEMARCLLIQSNLPSHFWAEAVLTSNYLRNRCPTTNLNGSTPYEALFNKIPDLSHLREFGCEAFYLKKSPGQGKLDPRAEKCVLVGYSDETKGYRVYIPGKRLVTMVRDIKFSNSIIQSSEEFIDFGPEHESGKFANYPILTSESSQDTKAMIDEWSNQDLEENKKSDYETADSSQDSDDVIDDEPNLNSEEDINNDYEVADTFNNPRISRRAPGRPRLMRTGKRGRPKKIHNLADQVNVDAEYVENDGSIEHSFAAEVSNKEALDDPGWHEAIAEELKSIIKRNTWKIVSRPDEANVIGSRFVLCYKNDSSGNPVKKKARLVAKGFGQRPGIDFHATFSPVARFSSIRLLISLACRYKMNIRQLDITNAYLNSTLNEDVFMEAPALILKGLEFLIGNEPRDSPILSEAKKMYADLKDRNKVCHLQRALYGLKQSGRQWHKRLTEEILRFGAKSSKYDNCVYYFGQGEDMLLILVYVDDILVACKEESVINKFVQHISSAFDTKDLGRLNYCLGIQFEYKGQKIIMQQSNYIMEILKRYGMYESNSCVNPMIPGLKLERSNSDSNPYRELVGSLMYLAINTRPDIAYSVSMLSQFNDYHGNDHWLAAKRVLRYLKGTINYGLVFDRSNKEGIIGYTDADWGGCIVDRKSYTGFVFTFGGTAINWESKKQSSVALSSTEAEYVSIAEAVKECIYLKGFLNELGFHHLVDGTIYNDNHGAQKLANNPIYHGRSKHIDVKLHFVRDHLEDGSIQLKYMPTDKMLADCFTKALPGPRHHALAQSIGLKDHVC